MSGLGLAPAPSGGATGAGSVAGGASGPNPISTQHPSILPLRLEGGDVVVAAAAAPAADSVLLSGLAASLAPNPRDSPPNALVFGVASQGGPVSQLDAVVGSLKFRRFLACARNKLWWMTPEWGSTLARLPPETQFLLLELEEPGTYGLVLPLIDGDFRATLRPNK